MPKYDYQCEACGTVTEREFPMKEVKAKVKCECGKMAKRVWGSPNTIVRISLFDRSMYKGGEHPRAHRGRGY